ncbi:MAG: hydrogenase maturation nickel metallochaperone HypA [Candidatus Lokiarchaeota archaeon]|nr:hydrogenase maturation nickel metallochaperone HypA [Candidatus Lokiarchaeota archaeon]
MHEFAVANQIYQSSLETAIHHKAAKILEIKVELGDFTLVVEELLIFSFNVLKKQSPIIEEAELYITRSPGEILCNDCKKTSEIWFNEEQEISEENADELDLFTQKVHQSKDLRLMSVNLFKCRHCNSRNTDLLSGKDIVVKNIKVQD